MSCRQAIHGLRWRISVQHGIRGTSAPLLAIDPKQPKHLSRGHIIARGAKTRTTVKASTLPQGALPPLCQHEDDKTPERSYPTVLQQHLNNTRKFKDCVVLTRVGDFYEMYFDQVEEYAPLVNLKKAKRATSLGDVPMAGFQHTQLERYLKMFVQDLGKNVAISEQVRISEDERLTRGGTQQYDRKVTRIVTAGTLIDENFMDPYENNFLLSIHIDDALNTAERSTQDHDLYENYRKSPDVGLAWVDLSSADFFVQTTDLAALPSAVARIAPREVVMNTSMTKWDQTQLQKMIGEGNYSLNFHQPLRVQSKVSSWSDMTERDIPTDLASEMTSAEISAGSLILDYSQKHLLDMKIQLRVPSRRSDHDFMTIDKQSLRGLEIRNTLRDGLLQGSLLHSVRRTVTKSGARLLSQRLVSPSMSLSIINNRLDLAEEFKHYEALREDVTALLRRTSDTLRLLQKFSLGRGDADDLLGLANTIQIMDEITRHLHDHILAVQDGGTDKAEKDISRPDLTFMWDILARVDLERPLKIAERIENAIDEEGLSRQHLVEDQVELEAAEMATEVENAEAAGEKAPKLSRRMSKAVPLAVGDGSDEIWIMRKSASPTLGKAHDELHRLITAKVDLSTRLRTDLRADSLTLKWSAQLGHFCHIKGKDARNGLDRLAGARSIASTKTTRSFYLSEWTHLGVRIDDARRRIRSEEERVFAMLRNLVIENLVKLRRNAAVLDELDVACSSAVVATEGNLVRPILKLGSSLHIVGGRHPMVDVGLKGQGRQFTANDCLVGFEESICVITGPNMGGKSTYLRQNALIIILAQTGCFVPAEYAEIGLVDKIFSRVGSADNLFHDQSTFMVEMLETAEILRQATPRSLVIMDEVGRGTTPEDGVAVGYACLYHLHNVNKSRTLFATHFHSLADMTRDFERVGYYCTDIMEQPDGSWSFAHKLQRGVNRESHALKVAQLAGLPTLAIDVAKDVRDTLQLERERSAAEQAAVNAETRDVHKSAAGSG